MSDESKIIEDIAERLEFFFSDTNLRSDTWMQRELEQSNGAMLAINKLITFNTLKKITTDESKLVKATETIDWLKLNEAKDAIGRVTPFDKNKKFDNVPVTLFFDGLPVVESDSESKCRKVYGTRIKEVKDAVEGYVGDGVKVMLVRLRYHRNKDRDVPPTPLGSAFVEFKSADDQAKALKVLTASDEGKSPFEIAGSKVNVITMSEFLDNKRKERGDKQEKARKRKVDESENEEKTEENEIEMEDIPPIDIKWEKGCVIQLKGIPEGSDREAIKDSFKGLEIETEVCYIDYSRGQPDGAIRFSKPDEKISGIAEKFSNGEIKILDKAVDSACLLQGEEEEKYWNDFIAFKTNQRKQRLAERKGNKNKSSRRKKSRR